MVFRRYSFDALIRALAIGAGLSVAACDQGPGPVTGSASLPDVPVIQGSNLDTVSQTRLQDLYARIGTDPDNANSNGELGMLLQGYGFLDAAIDCYVRAAHFAPGDFEWPYFLGFAYAANGQLDQAVASLTAALEQRPALLAARIKLAHVYFARNDLVNAGRLFRESADAHPDRGEPLYGLGRVAVRYGDVGGAIELYEQALQLSGHSADLHYALAEAWRLQGDTGKAQAQLDLFKQYRDVPIKGNSPLPMAVINYIGNTDNVEPERPEQSSTANIAGEFDVDSEIRFVESELARGIDDPGLYASLMVLYGRKGNGEQAFANYMLANEAMPANPRLHFVAGNTFLALQDYEHARFAYSRVLQTQPNNANVHHQMAVTFDFSGDAPAAIEHYQKALALDASREVTRQLLGRRLALSQRFEEALGHYQPKPGDGSVPAWVALARAGAATQSGNAAERDKWLNEANRIARLTGDEVVGRVAMQRLSGEKVGN